jgi:menaquinone-dependent protoporphyrinogen oxidase
MASVAAADSKRHMRPILAAGAARRVRTKPQHPYGPLRTPAPPGTAKLPFMSRVLVVYASTHGHTAKIARRIGDVLRAEGLEPDLREAKSAADVPIGDYSGVILGASIHGGHHQREAIDWAKRHAAALGGMPSAFFSVCLVAAEDDDESRAAARKFIDDFADETGWTPGRATTFAGALQYLEYDHFTRTLIRLMMKRGGHPTDTSRDYDYTDWDAVERFAHDFAREVAGG